MYDEGDRNYGSPRICDVLEGRGLVCSENRKVRLMRLHRLPR